MSFPGGPLFGPGVPAGLSISRRNSAYSRIVLLSSGPSNSCCLETRSCIQNPAGGSRDLLEVEALSLWPWLGSSSSARSLPSLTQNPPVPVDLHLAHRDSSLSNLREAACSRS